MGWFDNWLSQIRNGRGIFGMNNQEETGYTAPGWLVPILGGEGSVRGDWRQVPTQTTAPRVTYQQTAQDARNDIAASMGMTPDQYEDYIRQQAFGQGQGGYISPPDQQFSTARPAQPTTTTPTSNRGAAGSRVTAAPVNNSKSNSRSRVMNTPPPPPMFQNSGMARGK